MSDNATHRIDVEHNWSDSESTTSRTSRGPFTYTYTQTCKDCYVHREVLDLDRSVQSPGESDTTECLKELQRAFGRIMETISEYEQMVFANSNYSNSVNFVEHLESFYEKSVKGDDINFRTIKYYLELEHEGTPKKARNKSLRKLLLLWKQGPVCNRCDNIFTTSELTEDHIVPRASGGQSKLPNLQLLCKTCNSNKADKYPSPDDVSPFEYEGESCNHLITCRELIRLEVN